jgi:hypothetical protein
MIQAGRPGGSFTVTHDITQCTRTRLFSQIG